MTLTPTTTRLLVEALKELTSLQQSALNLKIRAENIQAPEDAEVKRLCEKHGYGAVMDSAARQWFNHPDVPKGSCHTTYHCYTVVKQVTEQATVALAAAEREMEVNP